MVGKDRRVDLDRDRLIDSVKEKQIDSDRGRQVLLRGRVTCNFTAAEIVIQI